MQTPGEDEKSWQEEEDRECLNNQDASQYRALAARTNYFALDRPDTPSRHGPPPRKNVTLSSGEAENVAFVQMSCEMVSMTQLASELGLAFGLFQHLIADAAALVCMLMLLMLPLDQSSGPATPRLFCPVQSCPDHAHPSHRWVSCHTMRTHIEARLSGQLMGDIPSDWLRSQGFSVHARFARGFSACGSTAGLPRASTSWWRPTAIPRPTLAPLLGEHPAFGTSSQTGHGFGYRYHLGRATLGLGASSSPLRTSSHTGMSSHGPTS